MLEKGTPLTLGRTAFWGSVGWIASLYKLDLEFGVPRESLKGKNCLVLLRSSVLSWKEDKF